MPAADLKDCTFGDWKVLSRADNTARGAARWNCQCKCGTERPVLGTLLRNGESRSCGECGGLRLTGEEKQAFESQKRKEDSAREALANPDASVTVRETAERVLRLAPKHREALEAQVRERKQLALAEKTIEKSATALELLQGKYPEPAVLPGGAERDELLKALNAELPALTGPALLSARRWVLGRIAVLEDAIRQEQSEIAAQQADQEKRQAVIDQFACSNATARIMGKVSPVLRINNLDREKRDALTAYCREMLLNARKYAKTAVGADASGARKVAVAKHIENVYSELVDRLQLFTFDPHVDATSTSKWMNEEWADNALLPEYFAFRTLEEKCHVAYALRLFYKNTSQAAKLAAVPPYPDPIWPPEKPHQSLSGLQAKAMLPLESSWEREAQFKEQQEALEDLRVRDIKAYRELMKKGPDILETWSRMNSDERRELEKNNWKKARTFKEVEKYLKPIDTTVPNHIYLVPRNTLEQPNLKPAMYFPDGREAQPGRDIVRDVLHGWCLMPQPKCAEPEWGGGNRRMECVQDDYGNWVKRPVDKDARWEQDLTGHWKRVDGGASNLFSKPEPITFLKGDRHVPGSGRDHFREGHWWTQAEIDAVEGAGWTETPPSILPPLKPGIADSLTTVPPGIEEARARDKDRRFGKA